MITPDVEGRFEFGRMGVCHKGFRDYRMVDLRWCLCALLVQSEMAGLNHQTMNTKGLDEDLISRVMTTCFTNA
jgi:hypothetical protein